ncbi:hypothetical protein HDU84_000674, partial [Entophlyctis sp. JEL0112]
MAHPLYLLLLLGAIAQAISDVSTADVSQQIGLELGVLAGDVLEGSVPKAETVEATTTAETVEATTTAETVEAGGDEPPPTRRPPPRMASRKRKSSDAG